MASVSKMNRARSVSGRSSMTALGAILAPVTGCAQQMTTTEFGPAPSLPPPDSSLLPTVNVAKAVGWPKDSKPLAAPGTRVDAYARDLDHLR